MEEIMEMWKNTIMEVKGQSKGRVNPEKNEASWGSVNVHQTPSWFTHAQDSQSSQRHQPHKMPWYGSPCLSPRRN